MAAETAAPGVTPRSVAAPVVRGSVLTMGGYGASQVLRLGSNLILTRLLFPEVFGQLALVSILLTGLQMFSDVGTGPAIIQNPRGDDPAFLNTAWTVQCARGGALWLASWVIAWPAAAFYGQPTLRWLIPAAGFTALVGGFESTAMHTLQRNLRLGRLTVTDLTSQLVGAAAMVLLVVLDRWWFGANDPNAGWAVVSGGIATSLVRVVMSHTYLPGIRHRFQLDRESLHLMFGFGRWIFVSTLLTFFAAQSDRLVFGKMLPIAFLGVYSIASMLSALPTQAVVKLGAAIVFPAYSRLIGRSDFGNVFWRVRWPTLVGGAAIVSCLAAGGPFLVGFLYDRRYVEAGWILQYLAVGAWFQVLECTNGAAMLAKGYVRWVAAGSAAKVLGLAIAIPVGYRLGGFQGAIAGYVASDLVKYLTSAAGVQAAGLHGFLRDVLTTAVVGATAVAGYLAGAQFVGTSARSLVPLLVSSLVAGAAWAVLGLSWLRRERRGARSAAA